MPHGASQCLSLWQPQIIKSLGMTNMQTGVLNAIPFGIASVLMIFWGRSSDIRRERGRGIRRSPLALLATALVGSIATHAVVPTILILCVAVTATYIVKGPFWALATEWLSVGAAAAGIAQINAIGNIGGLVGTSLLGVIKDATGSYPLGLLPARVHFGDRLRVDARAQPERSECRWRANNSAPVRPQTDALKHRFNATSCGEGEAPALGADVSANNSASFSVIAPPSSSASTMVTARR